MDKTFHVLIHIFKLAIKGGGGSLIILATYIRRKDGVQTYLGTESKNRKEMDKEEQEQNEWIKTRTGL